MLIFFDTEYAYILAEATQSLSLQDDKVHDEEDGLWLGRTIIPRGLSLCEYTVNIPAANKGSNRDDETSGRVHIINDLHENVRFCDRPYVTDGPKCRFYAGVPILTPNGVSIGAYCALDDKPREGLHAKQIDFMQQMGRNIMDHLVSVRQRSDYGRGSRMLTSLGAFFRTAPADVQQEQSPAFRRQSSKISKPLVGGGEPAAKNTPAAPAQTDMGAGGVRSDTPVEAQAVPNATKTPNGGGESSIAKNFSGVDGDLDSTLADNVRTIFQKAAELIQAAAEVDSVIFLDVKSHGAGGQVSGRPRRKRRNMRTHSDAENSDSGTCSADSDDSLGRKLPKWCPILGQSKTMRGSPQHSVSAHYSAVVVQFLLRNYRRGRIWNFNSAGDASIEESASGSTSSSDSAPEEATAREGKKFDPRQQRHSRELMRIQKLFPGVRALCFVPMWDQTKARMSSIALMVAYSPLRIFTNDGELSFVRAFCDVVTASIAKLESSYEEQAKTQFISSISHELRSPLHGILGGVDCLQGQEKPDQLVLAQIEMCSTNLIDVIEHLLEYAKINNLSDNVKDSAGQSAGSLDESRHTGLRQVVSLADLTEEVVDAIFYSHSCSATEKASAVAYIIDSDLDPGWQCNISIGAWKRLCMNIVNNALKYTAQGYIKVSLTLAGATGKDAAAHLTVTDTGVGMSKEFLEYGLFEAFHQENSLSPGTGLGMSLVAKLVRSIKGQIEVRSEKNVGTTVKVSVPLKAMGVPTKRSKSTLRGLKLSICEPARLNVGADPARELQIDALSRNCKLKGAVLDAEDPDVRFVFEDDVLAMSSTERSELLKNIAALLVLCHNSRSAAAVASVLELEQADTHIACVAQPFGLIKTRKVLRACLPPDWTWSEAAPDGSDRRMSKVSDYDLSLPAKPIVVTSMRSAVQAAHSSETVLSDRTNVATTSIGDAPASVMDVEVFEKAVQLRPPIAKVEGDGEQKMSLLLVDDNDINLRILELYAKRNQHRYATAVNGQQAVEVYTKGWDDNCDAREGKHYAQVIFMDVNMPIMCGFEATRRIRSYEALHSLRPSVIIVLTGLGSTEAQEEAASCGVDIFLTKPVRSRELTLVLKSIGSGASDPSKHASRTDR